MEKRTIISCGILFMVICLLLGFSVGRPGLWVSSLSHWSIPASIALVMGAKAHAFLACEVNVRRDDIEAVFKAALTHRLVLNFRGEAEGASSDSLLDEVWKKTVAP